MIGGCLQNSRTFEEVYELIDDINYHFRLGLASSVYFPENGIRITLVIISFP
jgi:hypothetical protein